MASLPSRSLDQLLQEINRELPGGVDWKAGAATYLRQVFDRDGRENVEPYLLHKPFAKFQGDADHESRAIFLDLLHNFVNVVQLLRLPVGARILDVACGAGWLSQWLMRLGFEVVGVDMCHDLLCYARRRVEDDPLLRVSGEQLGAVFLQHDVESAPLPASAGLFDAAIFESCLHHFYNPVNALRHVAGALNDSGLAVLIEGENRQGPVKPEYMKVMHEFATIERPYSRSELQDILVYAGLPYVEFFGAVNGWYSPGSPRTCALPEYVRVAGDSCNRSVCAKSVSALRRIVPEWQPNSGNPVVARLGITAGMPGRSWSAPQSELLVQRACPRVLIEVGSHLPHQHGTPQHVTIATNTGQVRRVTLTPEHAVATVELVALEAGTEIHFASSAVFSPIWEGSADRRVLSFWIAVRDGEGSLLLPGE